MKTTSNITVTAIDKILFVLFFMLYAAVIIVASAILTGCAPADQTVIGISMEEEADSGSNRQEVSKLNDLGDSARSSTTGNGNNGINVASRDANSTQFTDGNDVSSNANNSGDDIDDDSDSDSDSDDSDTAKTLTSDSAVSGIIDSGINSSDIKASILQDTATSNGDTSSTIKDSGFLDTKTAIIADNGTIPDASSDSGQKSDVITITQDIITTVKDVVTDIIKDTSADIILDIIANSDNGGQKYDGGGQLDANGQPDIGGALDTQMVPDTGSTTVKDASTAGQDVQSVKDIQLTKDTQTQQDAETQQEAQTPAIPDVFTVPNNQTTWYTSKEYKYKVQYPSWVQATVLKTTDLQLTGNAQNKVGLTKEQLVAVAHFTLRTEFEYYPQYASYDGWWKNLYGKPDETATYQGQTLKYHSADGGGGFSRYTYVKIGKIGSLRIEMNFSMPPHLYVEGFVDKALEVLYMVTKSAQAVN